MSNEDSRLTPIEKAIIASISTIFTVGLSSLFVWLINSSSSLQKSDIEIIGKLNLINERVSVGKDQYETKIRADNLHNKLSNEIALIRANINQCTARVSRIEKIMEDGK